jgi:hypothetical protein
MNVNDDKNSFLEKDYQFISKPKANKNNRILPITPKNKKIIKQLDAINNIMHGIETDMNFNPQAKLENEIKKPPPPRHEITHQLEGRYPNESAAITDDDVIIEDDVITDDDVIIDEIPTEIDEKEDLNKETYLKEKKIYIAEQVKNSIEVSENVLLSQGNSPIDYNEVRRLVSEKIDNYAKNEAIKYKPDVAKICYDELDKQIHLKQQSAYGKRVENSIEICEKVLSQKNSTIDYNEVRRLVSEKINNYVKNKPIEQRSDIAKMCYEELERQIYLKEKKIYITEQVKNTIKICENVLSQKNSTIDYNEVRRLVSEKINNYIKHDEIKYKPDVTKICYEELDRQIHLK